MNVKTPEDLGLWVRQQRKAQALSQQSLAERAGVSRQWIIDVEAGKARTELGRVMLLLRCLDARMSLQARPLDEDGERP